MIRALNNGQQDEMVHFYLMGYTMKELAKFYDIPVQTINCYLKKKGVPRKKGRRNPDMLLKLKILIQGHEDEYPEIIEY